MAMVTTPGTRAVGARLSARSAARVEVPASADRAIRSEASERDGAEWAQIRAVPAAAHHLRAQEVVGLRPAHRGATPRRPRRCRRRDTGRGPFQPLPGEARLSRDEAESRVRARAAYGDRTHLFGVKVGIDAVLPTRSQAAWSTHLRAAVICTVGSTTSKFEGQEVKRGAERSQKDATGEDSDQGSPPWEAPRRFAPRLLRAGWWLMLAAESASCT